MALRFLLWLGTEPGHALSWLTLLLTYSVHALAWTLAAALVVRRRSLSSATQHLAWKLALLGPIVTALLATAPLEGANRALGS
ncbi:MAG: hypothetical protein KC492_25880, partial [Myxococcales bacterium]|nr:hypothetical protein [Myxococcales bacterium]